MIHYLNMLPDFTNNWDLAVGVFITYSLALLVAPLFLLGAALYAWLWVPPLEQVPERAPEQGTAESGSETKAL